MEPESSVEVLALIEDSKLPSTITSTTTTTTTTTLSTLEKKEQRSQRFKKRKRDSELIGDNNNNAEEDQHQKEQQENNNKRQTTDRRYEQGEDLSNSKEKLDSQRNGKNKERDSEREDRDRNRDRDRDNRDRWERGDRDRERNRDRDRDNRDRKDNRDDRDNKDRTDRDRDRDSKRRITTDKPERFRSYRGFDRNNNNNNNRNNDHHRDYDRKKDTRERLGYNFDLPYNVKYPQPPNSVSARIELLRATAIQELLDYYSSSLQEQFKMNAPLDAFNRWLIEQYSLPIKNSSEEATLDSYDPILPGVCELTNSQVIIREIVKNLPTSTYVSWGQRQKPSFNTLKIFDNYVSEATKIVEQHIRENSKAKVSIETDPTAVATINEDSSKNELQKLSEACLTDLKEMRVHIEEVKSNPKELTGEAIAGYIRRISDRCAPFFQMVYLPAVTDWYVRFTHKAMSLIRRLRDDPVVVPVNHSKEPTAIRRDSYYVVSFSGDEQKLSNLHYEKLRTLYKIHASGIDPGLYHFEERLYCLLRRYETCFGKHGSGFQAAAPDIVFNFLASEFGVCHETFASPLNCYFSRYNSAFPDTDGYFGSQGSFFDFNPKEGSFQLGTPNVEEVMNKAAHRVQSLLEQATGPMSFVMFVPDWNNPPADFLVVYSSSRFKQQDFLVEGNGYCYIKGNQQEPLLSTGSTTGLYFVAPFGSRVFILQNEAGAKRWPVTESKVQRLKDSFWESKALI